MTTTTGCVKWFNNKAGYGFITVTDNGESRDVFVHHTAIQVSQSQYKYLVQGEYVELTITPSDNDKHTVQVSSVHGVNGGKLMCETRNETRALREEYHQPTVMAQTPKFQRRSSVMQVRESRSPQLRKIDETEWTTVPTHVARQQHSSNNRRSRPQQRQPIVENTPQ